MGKLIQLVSEDLREKIEEYIVTHQLKAHDKLPSERSLCELFDANRITLREALKHMHSEGSIYTIHGKGNFIAEPKYTEDVRSFISYSAGWEADGYQTRSRVIDFYVTEAPKKAAQALECRIGTPLYLLKRVRYLNDIPLFLETAYIPVAYCPKLDSFNFNSCSLYSTLEQFYNIKLAHQEHTISIAKLDAFEAHLLGVQEGDAAFYIKGITKTSDGKPFEYCVSLNRADKYKMCGQLSADDGTV